MGVTTGDINRRHQQSKDASASRGGTDLEEPMRLPTPAIAGVAALCAATVMTAFVPGPAVGAPSASATSTASAASDAAQSDRKQGTYTSKVRGTFGREGTVRGTFSPERFVAQRGEVFAVGVLDATLRRGNGELVGKATRTVSIPVQSASTDGARGGAGCDILNLVLGPLDLNLLGLEIHLNRVVLDIVAVPGAGNLLGNLLCAVAGLLDGTGLNNLQLLRLSNLLNRILGLLG